MRRQLLTEVAILSVIVIWAAHYSIAKMGVSEFSPVVFTLLRFAGVTPLLLGWTWYTEGSVMISGRDWFQLVLVGFFGVALYQTCYIAAAKYTSAANASLLIALSPLFTCLLGALTGSERHTSTSLLGSVMAFSGVTLVIWSGNRGLGFSEETWRGDLIALAAGLLWGLYPLLTQPLLRRYSPLRVMAASSLVGSTFLLGFGWKRLQALQFQLVSMTAWWCLLYAIVLATAYALVIWYSAIERLGANRVMVHMYLVPALAMAISARYLNEIIRPSQVWGMAVILGGIALARKK
ncbi:MAG: DMT family transporter [Bacillota bacterium]